MKHEKTFAAIEKLKDVELELHRLKNALELANKALAQPAQEPDRQALQANGTHPAPCARHCEATAFNIVIRNLKAQLAQPAQSPNYTDCFNAKNYSAEERERMCLILLAEAQYWDAARYIRQMNTHKRPWVGLTDEEVKHMLELFVIPPHHVEMVVQAIEAKLKEKNTS